MLSWRKLLHILCILFNLWRFVQAFSQCSFTAVLTTHKVLGSSFISFMVTKGCAEPNSYQLPVLGIFSVKPVHVCYAVQMSFYLLFFFSFVNNIFWGWQTIKDEIQKFWKADIHLSFCVNIDKTYMYINRYVDIDIIDINLHVHKYRYIKISMAQKQ